VGIEACASSHHWSRELKVFGHTVKLMPPAYVKPFASRDVAFQLDGRMGSGGRLIDCLQSIVAFSLDQIDHCFLKSTIACSRYNLFVWGRIILSAVIVVLVVVWLLATWLLQKWLWGLW
jgi:hypothetical protein